MNDNQTVKEVKPPPMTQGAVMTTVRLVLSDLRLGLGSYRQSSAYHDYVAMEFACFPDKAVEETVASRFRTLCERHGWKVYRISRGRGNCIFVTLQESEMISSDGNKRMPM
jgi:hypothetical protein